MTTFDWAKIKPIGDELSKEYDEAHLRSAFGRYYYAPYCSTKYYLVDIGHSEYLSKKGSHNDLYTDLQKSPDENERKLGELLEKLFKKRVDADYLLEKNGKTLGEKYFQKELHDVESNSRKALQLVEILKNNPPGHRFKI